MIMSINYQIIQNIKLRIGSGQAYYSSCWSLLVLAGHNDSLQMMIKPVYDDQCISSRVTANKLSLLLARHGVSIIRC